MRKGFFFIVGLFVLFACNNQQTDTTIHVKEGKRVSKLSADSPSAKVMEKAANARLKAREKAEQERLKEQTTITMKPSVYDFGEIPNNTPVSTVFIIENTGKKPLLIRDAWASCGCTVPQWPKEPIMPGKTGELKVTFTSEPYQAGQKIQKNVTITGNFPGQVKKVTIKGKVDR